MPKDAGRVKMLSFPGVFPTVSHHVQVPAFPDGCRSHWGHGMAELCRDSYLVPGDGPEEDGPVCTFSKKDEHLP